MNMIEQLTPARARGSQTVAAALFLLIATGPLAEVLSENVSLLQWLHPAPFLLVTLTYGVPVLLIRELVVARRLNVFAIILLGLERSPSARK